MPTPKHPLKAEALELLRVGTSTGCVSDKLDINYNTVRGWASKEGITTRTRQRDGVEAEPLLGPRATSIVAGGGDGACARRSSPSARNNGGGAGA